MVYVDALASGDYPLCEEAALRYAHETLEPGIQPGVSVADALA
jgi:hypothetical protein